MSEPTLQFQWTPRLVVHEAADPAKDAYKRFSHLDTHVVRPPYREGMRVGDTVAFVRFDITSCGTLMPERTRLGFAKIAVRFWDEKGNLVLYLGEVSL